MIDLTGIASASGRLPWHRPSLWRSGVAALVISAACVQFAAAQSAAASDAELRTLSVNARGVEEGKRLAQSTCAGCHGDNGVSPNEGVPNLAGQRPAYLYIELKAYQSGVRGATVMTDMVRRLSDDMLMKLAAYFSSLAPPQHKEANRVAAVDPLEAGRAAAAACAGCHGEIGVTKTPGMPSLVGLHPKFLTAALAAYKSGQRKNDLMKSMLASVTDANISNIALYYALQKPARAETPAPGDKDNGATASAGCAGCHGADGVSANPAFPSLAGQDAAYLASALKAYQQGTRDDATMKALTASLDDAAIKDLSAFFAAQEPKPPSVAKPLSVEELAQRCDRCHGVNGNSRDVRLPSLAAQRRDYLEKVLRDYQTGARKSPQMAAMSGILTEQDVLNLAGHYARQLAREPVFVTVPEK